MTEEDTFIPLRALQHVIYCDRRAALIHVERVWAENSLTALGHVLHERTDEPGTDIRRGVKVVRALRIRSTQFGIAGIADCVEFRGSGVVVPIETKRGTAGQRLADQVQLCAQALCLEEMLSIAIVTGELFYAASRKRVVVAIDESLRATTVKAIATMRAIVDQQLLPQPVFGPKCRKCSLIDLCQPEMTERAKRASGYVAQVLAAAERS